MDAAQIEFDAFTVVILIVKITFYLLVMINVFWLHYDRYTASQYPWTQRWEHRLEFVYVILTASLMLYLFNPWSPRLKYVDEEVILTFFLFAVVMITRANWERFASNIHLPSSLSLSLSSSLL